MSACSSEGSVGRTTTTATPTKAKSAPAYPASVVLKPQQKRTPYVALQAGKEAARQQSSEPDKAALPGWLPLLITLNTMLTILSNI